MTTAASTSVPSDSYGSPSPTGIPPLTWGNIFGYGLGDVANNFAFAMGALFLLNYYTDVAGIAAAAAGTMLLLVRIFDAVMDVVAGRVVDKTSTRFGRFRPFLLWGAVPLMLCSVLVFSVPQSWGASEKLIYAYVTYAALGLCYSFVNIPYGSLATVMTQVPEERARVASSRTIQAQLTFTFLALVLGANIRGTKDPVALQSIFTTYTAALAIVGVLLYIACFKLTREAVPRAVERVDFKSSLKTIGSNVPLIMLCLSALCVLAGFFSMVSSTLFYARSIVGDVGSFIIITAINTLGGALLAAPLVPALVRKIGKKGTFILGCALSLLGYLAVYMTPPTNVYLVYAVFFIVAIGATMVLTVMWALEADTVEYGEWKTGVRIEGLTYSLFSFTRKCGQAIGGSIPAYLLAGAGYAPGAPATNAVKEAIMSGFSLAPAICFVAALILMSAYPLTDGRFRQIVREIAERRGQSGAPRPVG
jgi:glucuronide carrier protein